MDIFVKHKSKSFKNKQRWNNSIIKMCNMRYQNVQSRFIKNREAKGLLTNLSINFTLFSIYYVVLCLLYFWYSVIFDYFCNDFIVDLFTENKEIVIIIIIIIIIRC